MFVLVSWRALTTLNSPPSRIYIISFLQSMILNWNIYKLCIFVFFWPNKETINELTEQIATLTYGSGSVADASLTDSSFFVAPPQESLPPTVSSQGNGMFLKSYLISNFMVYYLYLKI